MTTQASNIVDQTIEGIHVVSTCAPPSSPALSPLLFVHGGFHGAWTWNHFQTFFTNEGYNTYAFDWFDHGTSAKKGEETLKASSIADVTEEIGIVHSRLISPHHSLPPVVFGHSMGGMAGMKYLEKVSKGDVRALILVCPVLPVEVGAKQQNLPDFDESKLYPPPPFEITRKIFFEEIDDTQAHLIFSRLTMESPKRIKEALQCTISVPKETFVKCPIFVIGAELDAITPCNDVEKLAKLYDLPFYEVSGLGHGLPMVPGWEGVARKILEWLKTLDM